MTRGRQWSLGDLVLVVLATREPSGKVDGMIDLAARAALSDGGIVEAMFASWAAVDVPRYTESVEAVRDLGSRCGIATDSRAITYGYEGLAKGPEGHERACGFNAATAEVAALLIALRKSMAGHGLDFPSSPGA